MEIWGVMFLFCAAEKQINKSLSSEDLVIACWFGADICCNNDNINLSTLTL